jgi:hypothetical protein
VSTLKIDKEEFVERVIVLWNCSDRTLRDAIDTVAFNMKIEAEEGRRIWGESGLGPFQIMRLKHS